MKRATALFAALSILLFSAAAFAEGFGEVKKEFSAEQVTTFGKGQSPFPMPGGQAMPTPGPRVTKVYMTKTCARWDEGTTSTVVRQDKKVVYIIDHAAKTYTEMAFDPKDLPAFLRDFEKAVDKKKLGSERAEGYACTKYQITVKMDQVMGEEMRRQMEAMAGAEGAQGEEMKRMMAQMNRDIVSTVWIADSLGVPVKTVTDDGTTTILRNIVAAPQSPKLFMPPAGYKKTESPGMPGQAGPPAGKKAKGKSGK